MAIAKPTIKKSSGKLPDGVNNADLVWPKPKDPLVHDAGNRGVLTFVETSGFGWCLATLSITNRGRTYAVRVADGSSVRVGSGPHVLCTINVYVRKSRLKALQRYLDLYTAGGQRAGEIRDRISSRRAEGVERRAAGQSYWRWDV